MKAEEPSYLSYIAYVTLREAWDITKTQFYVWVFLSVFFMVAGAAGVLGAGAAKSWFGDDVPNWVWWVVIWCGLSWMMRGEEIKIPFPKLTFGQWLLYSAGVFLIAWMFTVLPWWASSPLWLSLFVIGGAIDELVAKGKENCAKLHEPPAESLPNAWEA
ncbi:hypothetical protein [Caenimonas soli]|uniref:hypothetical protein n=1 Tax=Caenimonas soli TaxID=2735555 RepID=UPI001557D12D|nr:hypothetical protein [Caenimonas soli]NPC57846.1 hypothetical protein [Caenimonas soli]